MQAFAVRLSLLTPIELRSLLHFDGLLGSLLYSRGRTMLQMPLRRTGAMWHASAAVLESGPFGLLSSTVNRVKRVMPESIPAGVLDHLKPAKRKIGSMSPMRAAIHRHSLYDGARAVWFSAYGDVDEVTDLLSDVRNVGSMGRAGSGRIGGIEMFGAGGDTRAGVATAAGEPLRSVRLEDWERLGLGPCAAAIISLQSYEPPYWTGLHASCISPIQVSLTGSAPEVRAMLNVGDSLTAG